MSLFQLVLAISTLFGTAALLAVLVRGASQIGYLQNIETCSGSTPPVVSVIIAARDEEQKIERGLESILRQNYALLEIVVVDDRSTDGTGEIISRMMKKHPELRTIRIDELPPGWLGKNHALWRGASVSRGEFLLFTDADVVFDPSTVSRAVSWMTRNNLDHLTVSPDLKMPGLMLNSFAILFTILFSIYSLPWKARDPNSKSFIGIGAFNMVRSSIYGEIGTHQEIAMRPDDDMKLGRLVKKNRFSQDFLNGSGLLSVEWYSSVRELINGMEKNAFAGTEYSVSIVLAGTACCLALFVWPFVGVFLSSGLPRYLNLATAFCLLLIALATAARSRINTAAVPLFPLAGCLFVFILWNSMIKAFVNKGISWRGTHYNLGELRKNRV